MKKPVVGVLMGSKSDFPVMKETAALLGKFGIPHEVKVLSAHRMPEETVRYAKRAIDRGIKIIIAGAGGAAHLAGAVASHTILPVIGVPIESRSLRGMDSLLSTVQMPSGIPVATMAIGKAGARNAAILAAQILAVEDSGIQRKLKAYKSKLRRKKSTGRIRS